MSFAIDDQLNLQLLSPLQKLGDGTEIANSLIPTLVFPVTTLILRLTGGCEPSVQFISV